MCIRDRKYPPSFRSFRRVRARLQLPQHTRPLRLSLIHISGILFHIVSGDAVDVCDRLDKGLLTFGILLGDMDTVSYTHLPG